MALAATTCPKCRYERQATDTAPDWQCPSCGVAYSKVMNEGYVPPSQVRYSPRTEPSGGWGKWIAVAFIASGIYLGFAHPWRHAPERAPIIAAASAGQPDVLLYATSWCPYCAKAREFFQTHGIHYTEYDIEHNAAAAEGYRRLRVRGVPAVVVGDEVVHGYDPEQMATLLQPWMK